jgi:DNA-binding transcriptional LysR family regulator
LHLTVKREGPESHLNALRSRELDALVIDPRNLPPSDEFKVELVTNFRSGFIVRRDHPLAGAESLDFAALLDYPMTSSPFSDEAARSMVMQFGHSANPAQFITMTCDDWKSMLNAVRVTDAINLGAIAIARELIAAGELVELNVTPRLQTTVRMALVTMAGRVELPAMKVLRAFVEETLQTENARA